MSSVFETSILKLVSNKAEQTLIDLTEFFLKNTLVEMVNFKNPHMPPMVTLMEIETPNLRNLDKQT